MSERLSAMLLGSRWCSLTRTRDLACLASPHTFLGLQLDMACRPNFLVRVVLAAESGSIVRRRLHCLAAHADLLFERIKDGWGLTQRLRVP